MDTDITENDAYTLGYMDAADKLPNLVTEPFQQCEN